MKSEWLVKHLEALAGNCIAGKFGGRVIIDWSGSLSLEALISAPAGRLDLDDGEWLAQGDIRRED